MLIICLISMFDCIGKVSGCLGRYVEGREIGVGWSQKAMPRLCLNVITLKELLLHTPRTLSGNL